MNHSFLNRQIIKLLFSMIIIVIPVFSQPGPDEIFKEFIYSPKHNARSHTATHFSELDPNCQRDFSKTHKWAQNKPRMVIKPLEIDIKQSVRAEMAIEFWGGHSGTSSQKFKVNGHDWIDLPQPENTPTSPYCYYRTLLGNKSVPIPLDLLQNGPNIFQFTCGPQICNNYNFGFYWIYSFTVRIYYEDSRSHPNGKITSPASGTEIGDNPKFLLEHTSQDSINRVDFIGFYEDFDWEGDGIFKTWHYQTRYGQIQHHVGTVYEDPYQVTWRTALIPDQQDPVKIMAKITDCNGMCYTTKAVKNLKLMRPDRSIKMYKSSEIPEVFAVRTGKRKSCKIEVPDTMDHAKSARIIVSTWSGATDDGTIHEILFNQKRIGDNFGVFHNYSFDMLSVPLEDILQGTNIVEIHSKYHGHALEINWPGPALLIEFEK
jgi:hypothetical protein